ncbi:glycosyltransferase [Ktedonosporobacter rubrisoli]|uniref:Glycosyltransferase n=1 Tax=Ktedonosporobacter rubrisoli TaxID=2509675 RepID=A0A4P6JX68_KTERU|nr:glycosyltransferase [Ktedonosporobacter rubrisoli]QBD79616.1 glycosyltransferase [Ktedonosporobacter rubrisoli]
MPIERHAMTIQPQTSIANQEHTHTQGGEDQQANPRFSVILCTYNRRNLVLSMLASLRRQTLAYEQFEVIVIDNGSTDGTVSTVYSYVNAGQPRKRRLEQAWNVQCLVEPYRGLTHARNRGLQAAQGDIAVFLDDDALADPFYLEHLLNAYEETGADAIGGCVELRWEAPRPYWLTDSLLGMLGYFVPLSSRAPLPEGLNFGSSNFSVKLAVLRKVGLFPTLPAHSALTPAELQVTDLCRRLRQHGYRLWYEPRALVHHRVHAARLQQAFFCARAYRYGRAEVVLEYMRSIEEQVEAPRSTLQMLSALLRECYELAHIALVHRPLLFLASKPTDERLLAAIAQARCWGRVLQQMKLLEHAPVLTSHPAVLLVLSEPKEASLFVRKLREQNILCVTCVASLSLAWIWRHRAYEGQSIGIIHFYRPGAYNLNHWQRQLLCFLLSLAQKLGLRVVTTDAGGWWQNDRSLRFFSRRAFERKLEACSDIILTYTRQPERIYPDKKILSHVRCLPHPGFLGHYPQPVAREEAHKQLGLPQGNGFVYLCFADLHTERELVHLIEAFFDVGMHYPDRLPQLLLIGAPRDKELPLSITKRAAINPAIHLFMQPEKQDLPLYLGAAQAVVIPHFAQSSAGVLETAMLALSHELSVIVPDLPRFHGMLPPHASILYDATSRKALVQAMLKVQKLKYNLTEKGIAALEAESSWRKYALRLQKIYKQLLKY